MACASALGGLPSLFYSETRTNSKNIREFRGSTVSGGRALLGRRRYVTIASKAAGDGSDSSGSIVKYVQNAWGNSEDRLALVGLGFAAIAAVWASSNLITAIDKLPLISSVLEFIGILFSWWFIYRYLLFKPDREELVKNVKSNLSDILGR